MRIAIRNLRSFVLLTLLNHVKERPGPMRGLINEDKATMELKNYFSRVQAICQNWKI